MNPGALTGRNPGPLPRPWSLCRRGLLPRKAHGAPVERRPLAVDHAGPSSRVAPGRYATSMPPGTAPGGPLRWAMSTCSEGFLEPLSGTPVPGPRRPLRTAEITPLGAAYRAPFICPKNPVIGLKPSSTASLASRILCRGFEDSTSPLFIGSWAVEWLPTLRGESVGQALEIDPLAVDESWVFEGPRGLSGECPGEGWTTRRFSTAPPRPLRIHHQHPDPLQHSPSQRLTSIGSQVVHDLGPPLRL